MLDRDKQLTRVVRSSYHARHRKVVGSKGYYGARSRNLKQPNKLLRAMQYATRDRKVRKEFSEHYGFKNKSGHKGI